MKRAILWAISVCLVLSANLPAQPVDHCNLAPVVVGCAGLQCDTFYDGQTVAGQVCSGMDGNDLCFYFTAADGYDFNDLQLWIGESCYDFPQDANGFPVVDSFPYQSGDISGTTEHTVCIPLDEIFEFVCEEVNQVQEYCVIAFIDMNTPDGNSVGIWVGDKEIANVGGGGGGNGDVDPEDYSGCITWDNGDGGITGWADPCENINVWLNNDTSLCWDVTYNNDGTWTYHYHLEVGDTKNISHMILQVSDSFTEDNYLSGPDPSLDTYSSTTQGGSNPAMPCAMTGLKWSDQNDTQWDLVFDSNRAPTWGDFYAVDGKKPGHNGEPNEIPVIWNVGFTCPDSDTPALTENGEWDHIVVPDTNTAPIVEPNQVAYAFCVKIKCNCQGHVECTKIPVEIDVNDVNDWFNDPNTRWSDGKPGHNPFLGIYSDPNVTEPNEWIYDVNYSIFLELCPCDVSTYGPYQGYDDPLAVLLRGAIVDDGGESCRGAFIIWPQGGSPAITPWSAAIYETGDVFTQFLDGLKPNTTYFYQAIAKNSVSMSIGGVKFFTTGSP